MLQIVDLCSAVLLWLADAMTLTYQIVAK